MIDEIYNYRQSNLPTAQVSEEWETLCIKFEILLNEEQLVMFHKLCDLQSASASNEMRAAYKVGFKDGIALMTEVQG